MGRLAEKIDKRRKNYHAFKEDVDSYFTARIIVSDMQDWERMIAFLNPNQAMAYGITVHSKVSIIRLDWEEIVADVAFSNRVTIWTIAASAELAKRYKINNLEMVGVCLTEWASITTNAIRKKMKWEPITYEETYSIIKDISENKLDETMMTYYVASSYFYPTSDEETYQTAKAMAECGSMFKYPKWEIIADKHCIGWVPGNETTMALIPLIASLWIKIPKNFSKSITSPAATWECVNVLMNINFDKEGIEELVKKVNCCLVRGWGLDLAPADDKLIKVQYPLSMQSKAKVVSSIMAKKYAMWVTHSLIDIPVWPTAKVTSMEEAKDWKQRFEIVGKKLWMKMSVQITQANEVIWNWVWAVLQVREVLRILQQHPDRPKDLEDKIIFLGGKLIENIWLVTGKSAMNLARHQLETGAAWNKMKEIIAAQWGNPDIDSESLELWKFTYDVVAEKAWKITWMDLHDVNAVCRRLGCPIIDQAWMYIYKKTWSSVKKGDVIATLYAQDEINLNAWIKAIKEKNPFQISSDTLSNVANKWWKILKTLSKVGQMNVEDLILRKNKEEEKKEKPKKDITPKKTKKWETTK